jgi:hypothetical protein
MRMGRGRPVPCPDSRIKKQCVGKRTGGMEADPIFIAMCGQTFQVIGSFFTPKTIEL